MRERRLPKLGLLGLITDGYEPNFPGITARQEAFAREIIAELSDVEQIFQNVYGYLSPGGWFVFDLLNEREVSTSEPFEMDFTESTRVWFQMTRPGEKKVNLKIRVYENGELEFEENIRETIHDPDVICDMLRSCGFREVRCSDRLLEDANPGTTWFLTARK